MYNHACLQTELAVNFLLQHLPTAGPIDSCVRQMRAPEVPPPALPSNHMFQRLLDLAASSTGPFAPVGGIDAPQVRRTTQELWTNPLVPYSRTCTRPCSWSGEQHKEDWRCCTTATWQQSVSGRCPSGL